MARRLSELPSRQTAAPSCHCPCTRLETEAGREQKLAYIPSQASWGVSWNPFVFSWIASLIEPYHWLLAFSPVPPKFVLDLACTLKHNGHYEFTEY
jgi:hypothetical protein